MELQELFEESVKIHENDFFSKKFYYSYSSLSKLMWSPQVFYQMYVLGLKEEKMEQHLLQGKLIHLLLLQPEKFKDEFMLCPTSLPTGNLRAVVDAVFRHHKELKATGDLRSELLDFTDAILDVMRDMNYHQSLKTDQQRLDKILTEDAKNYWNFLQEKGDKTLVDFDTLKFCEDAVQLIRMNKSVCELIGCDITEFDNKEVINEEPFQLDVPGKVWGLKGIIDNQVIDHDKKVININDIKTTSKDLKDFKESVEYYSYWLQAVIYLIASTIKHKDLMDNGYEIRFNFVVIDRTFQTYAFPVSEPTMNEWLTKFNQIMEKVEWHYDNRSYELPYEFATGAVVL